MAKKQYLDLEGLTTYDEKIKSYIDSADAATSAKLTSGTIVVKEAQHATSADTATNATNATNANHATSADSATTADSATKATQDASGNVITSTYETKTDATAKLAEAKGYTDTIAAGKSDKTHNHDDKYDELGAAEAAESAANAYTDGKIANLLDNSTEAVDSIMELAEAMKDNADAIEALEGIASGKADAEHDHDIEDVTGLQNALNAKAAQSSLDSHTGNGDIHVTAAQKTNWTAAYTHSTSAHAPSNAQANVIETIKVNGTALTPTSKAVNITVPTNYLTAADIAGKADKATTLSGYGITDAYTKTEVDNKLSTKAAQSSLDSVSSVANEAKSAAAANTQSITAHTSSINTHTSQISALQGLVGEGVEAIPTASITALF